MLQILPKFRFPGFRLLHWYAAQYFVKTLKVVNKKNFPIQKYLYYGYKSLKNVLKKWRYNKINVSVYLKF